MIFNAGSCGVDTDHDRSIRRALNKSVYQITGIVAEGDEKRAIWKVMRGGSERRCLVDPWRTWIGCGRLDFISCSAEVAGCHDLDARCLCWRLDVRVFGQCVALRCAGFGWIGR